MKTHLVSIRNIFWDTGYLTFPSKKSRWQGNVLDKGTGSLNYLYYSCLLWFRRKMKVIIFRTMKHNIFTVQMINFLTQVFLVVYKIMQDKRVNLVAIPPCWPRGRKVTCITLNMCSENEPYVNHFCDMCHVWAAVKQNRSSSMSIILTS